MKDKYYTPEIEEFHVGFEFYMPVLREDNNGDLYRDKYCKHIWTEKNNMWEQFNLEHKSNGDTVISVPECLTVKYLDREDIESLGFELGVVDCGQDTNHKELGIEKSIGDGYIGTFFLEPTNGFNIEIFDTYYEIKNKSELKRLLKQLGV